MKSYSVEISTTAEKQLRKLNRVELLRVVGAIQQLAHNPFPHGFRKLTGYDDLFRIRVGTFRVLYSVEKARLVVVVLKVGHRKDVYR